MTHSIQTKRTTAAPPNLVTEGETPTLSVVIVTKNEEDRICNCIESVFRAADGLEPFEVVLVDSSSTDRTVDLAREYPITVLRIPEEHISVGAGRFVGQQVARGDLMLQADGDMELREDWLEHAITYLRSHDVAGVEGWLNESDNTEPMHVDSIAGVALYERAALESIGGFAPYLRSYEDIEVGLRLTAAGHSLVRLPTVSAEHPVADPLSEPFRRWRAGYYHGVGQAIRYSTSEPRVLLKLLARQKYKFALVGWLVVGLLSLLSVYAFVAWVLVSLFAFTIVAKNLGVRGAYQFLMTKTLSSIGTTGGLFDPMPPADSYPLDAVEVVQDGPLPQAYARDQLQ
jgi:glycosyltransferase involved in cell wall biosynthesis